MRRTAYEPHHDCEVCCDSGIDLVFGTPCTECVRAELAAAVRKRIANPPPQDPAEIRAELLWSAFRDDPPAWIVETLDNAPATWEPEPWLNRPPVTRRRELPVGVWLAILAAPVVALIAIL